MSPLNITQPWGIWSIMATIRWCPIFPKWDIYQSMPMDNQWPKSERRTPWDILGSRFLVRQFMVHSWRKKKHFLPLTLLPPNDLMDHNWDTMGISWHYSWITSQSVVILIYASDPWYMFLWSWFPLRPVCPMARGHPHNGGARLFGVQVVHWSASLS